jgi:hypothetical protein
MGQYCDSKALEKNWFYWLMSSTTPDLECYRKHGLLWTKIIGDTNTNILPDPRSPNRVHCIALATPIYLNSYDGIPQSEGVAFVNGTPQTITLPTEDDDLNLLSDSWLHRLDTTFAQRDEVIPSLEADGYIKELPTEQTWHAVLNDINKMCRGIVLRFKQPTEEEQNDLANEALLQVTDKLATYKLVYTPGRAPVFNLLTTTIYRCMYSIMNRRKTQRQGFQNYVDSVQSGIIPRRKPIKTG